MEPFINATFKNNSKTIVETWNGYDGELLKTLSQVMNFSTEFVDCKHNWGSKLSNGTWTGIVGAVHQQVNDRAILVIIFTLLKLFDFTES